MAHWAAILAGGEGSRLRGITNTLEGDDRPKQFSRLLSGNTLLDETRARVAASIGEDRTAIVTTAHHRRYYDAALSAVPSHLLVEQPASRGTAAAIAFALGRIARLDPGAIISFFPSDHYYRCVSVVQQAVHLALLTANVYRDRLVLIGASAERAEADYGWILPGAIAPTPFSDHPVYAVEGFCEKPDATRATALLERGGLWNTFITVGSVHALTSALRKAIPAYGRFVQALSRTQDDASESAVVRDGYVTLPSTCFSSQVLTRVADMCLAVRMTGSGWLDVGRPDRLSAAREELGETMLAVPPPAGALQIA